MDGSITVTNYFIVECLGQRRIVEGTKVHNEVRFMAYLVKSELSEKSYHGWTCGGAIISPLHILTAAACVIDVDHLYAIVGYNKYVGADALDDDACTRKRKKKVIKTCAPKSYNVEFSGWTSHDIGVAMLEAPLDFTDVTYKIDCSYPPAPIKVNFDPQYETPETDVVAMGWGHARKLRLPEDLQDHNEQFLREASLLIAKREVCEKKFDNLPAVEQIVGTDIICVEGQGNLNAEGKLRLDESDQPKCDEDKGKPTNATTHAPQNNTTNDAKTNKPVESTTKVSVDNENIEKTTATTLKETETTRTTKTSETTTKTTTTTTTPKATTTTTTTTKTTTTKKKKIVDDPNGSKLVHPQARSVSIIKSQYLDLYDDDAVYDELFKKMGARRRHNGQRYVNTRRLGLCQNDHGGPLIAWMGVNPIVIGVASTNLYNGSYDCISPNLFTSTMKNEWFIKCVVTEDPKNVRRCNKQALRSGHSEIVVKTSDWTPGSNKRPRVDPKILPVVHLQKAIDTYLRDYRNTHNNKQPANQRQSKALSPNLERQLQDKQKSHNIHNGHKKRTKHLQQANQPGQQHKISSQPQNVLRQRAIPNDKQNIPSLQHQKHNYQQRAPNYQQNTPNHQQGAANLQQNIPNYQQQAPNYQPNIPNYQQEAVNYMQIIRNQQQAPNYQHNILNHQHLAPNYQQNTPNHKQPDRLGVSDPRNNHKVTVLELRPQKNLRDIARLKSTPRVRVTTPRRRPVSRKPGGYARRRTIVWRRSVTRIEGSTLTMHYRNQSRVIKSSHAGRSEFFFKIKV